MTGANASEAELVRARLGERRIPGIIDLHTHFMPQPVMDKVWRYFDQVGPLTGRPWPITYRFDDVVEALERIQPHDWRRFLRERLDRHEPQAPLDGLERAGWRLSWAETESPLAHNSDSEWRSDDFAYSLGLYLKRDGQVDGVLWDSPAWSAGLSRAVQLVAVNGTAYKAERLAAAITANKSGQAPIALLLREGERYPSITLDYRGGLRYPRLTRIEDRPERLDAELLAPRRWLGRRNPSAGSTAWRGAA